ncbi:hypothetical protein OLH07_07215, partial [Streptococcus pneumoniae]|nr:hypothetical protein [Streptococcus pneumoniae]
KKHPLGEKRNHPGSKLRQGFWMVFRFGVNNWGKIIFIKTIQLLVIDGIMLALLTFKKGGLLGTGF